MTATHEDNIDLNMNLKTQATPRLGFDSPLFLAVDCFADGSSGDRNWDSNNRRVVEFASADDMRAAVDDGALRYLYFKDLADQLEDLDDNPFPVKVGLVDYDKYDTANGDGEDYNPDSPEALYANAYEACKSADPGFYFVAPDIAADSTSYVNEDTDGDTNTESVTGDVLLANLAKKVANDHRQTLFQLGTDQWKTSSVPSNQLGTASGGLVTNDVERWSWIYHPDTFQDASSEATGNDNFPEDADTSGDKTGTEGKRAFVNLVYAARHLQQELDTQSGPSDLELCPLVQMTEDLTESERETITREIDAEVGSDGNGGNVALPLPPSEAFLDPGKTARGYAIFEIMSLDWLYSRGSAKLREIKLRYTKDDEKIPVSEEGQEIVRNALGQVLSQGERIDHFVPGSTVTTFPSITDTDRQADRIRATVQGTFELTARNFEVEVFLSR